MKMWWSLMLPRAFCIMVVILSEPLYGIMKTYRCIVVFLKILPMHYVPTLITLHRLSDFDI
jgi:hypothetical protein